MGQMQHNCFEAMFSAWFSAVPVITQTRCTCSWTNDQEHCHACGRELRADDASRAREGVMEGGWGAAGRTCPSPTE
eukprot:6373646-Prymnesium_polylepis.1